MKVYCIRQKSTGLFIPRLETGKRRGGAHLEPSNEREPRIFHNRLAARSFLGCWLQGIFKNDTFMTIDGEENNGLTVEPQPHHKKDDMEIVEFECFEGSINSIWNSALEELGLAARVCEIFPEEPILATLDRIIGKLKR